MLIESARLMIRAYLEEIESLDSLDKMELAMELESFIDDNVKHVKSLGCFESIYHEPDVDRLIKAFAGHYSSDYSAFKFTTTPKVYSYLQYVEAQS